MYHRDEVAAAGSAVTGHLRPLASLTPQDRSVQGSPFGLTHILAIAKRRILLIVSVLILGAALSVALALSLPKVYQASVEILLVRIDTRPFDPEGREERDRSAVETEMDVLRSRSLARSVVNALGLVDDPRFNTSLADRSGTIATLLQWARGVGASVDQGAASSPEISKDAPLSLSAQRDLAISNLLSIIKVTRSGESLAIEVSVTSDDPEFASILANTIAGQYVSYSLEAKQDPRTDTSVRRMQGAHLTSLRSEEARLERERATLASRFGSNHPKMIDADAALVSARSLIAQELERLESEVATQAHRPGARVISAAQIPTEPSFPKPKLVFAGGILASILAAAVLAAMKEGADTRLRSPETLVDLTGVAALACLPNVPRRLGIHGRLTNNYIASQPQSPFADAVRLMYARCFLTRSFSGPQVLTITSSRNQEGKSVVAAALASTCAADGLRTILVDLDLRSSRKRENRSDAHAFTINEFFSGQCSLHDAIGVSSFDSRVHFLSSDPVEQTDPLPWKSTQLRETIQSLRSLYDIVIIDTPSVLTANDVSWISPLSDVVVLVVRSGRTRAESVSEALSSLRMSKAPVFGTVLNGAAV